MRSTTYPSQSTKVTGIALNSVNYDSASDQIIHWAKHKQHRYVCICNVHSVTSSSWTPQLQRALNNADMNTADGIPLVWMQRALGVNGASRVYGPTLMLHTLEKASAEKLRVAFYGGHEERMPKLLAKVRKDYPGVEIVESVIPPFRPLSKEEDDCYTEQLAKAQADIIFVGIGCPKQEIWMQAHSHRIQGVMLGVGAAFDFHAGAVEQAPAHIQSMGLEWAFRLYREPKRLFRRYLSTNPIFVLRAAKQLLQAKLARRNFQQLNYQQEDQMASSIMAAKHVAICIATYQRPLLLSDLLSSINQCKRPKGMQIEIRIIDNDCNGSAQAAVDAFREQAHGYQSISYTIEPRQNIAHARNAAIKQGEADAYIFVDDDETVSTNWLMQLATTAHNHQADAVFGPVQAKLGNYTGAWQERGRFYAKDVPTAGTPLDWRETRTSNTWVHGTWFNQRDFRFDAKLGRSGGSDSDLFARMAEAGAVYVSSKEASVEEFVPADRATFRWLCKRAYRNGLIYERNLRATSEPNRPLARAVKRLCAATLLSLRGIPALAQLKPEHFIRGLLKLPLMLGGLYATIAPASTTRHVAYRNTSNPGAKRVAFLTNIVSPYRKPVFKALESMDDIDLRVFVDTANEFDRDWDVHMDDLPIEQTHCFSWQQTELTQAPTPFTQKLTKHLPYGLPYQLKRFSPEVVISLELGLRTAFAAVYCKLTRTELVIWSYQSRISAGQSKLRRLWRTALLKQASSVVGMGTQAREVLLSWGVPAEKIIDAPNAADQANYLITLNQDKTTRHIEALREVYAPNQKLALVVGRLIPLKGIEQIIKNWNALPPKVRAEWKLVFIGSGPLDHLIKQQNVREVELAGCVPPQSMPYWYAAADLHIFPTCGDVWGLVVNEASICGTPTLCSKYAGCYDDLIQDGKTGFQLDLASDEDSVRKLQAVLQSSKLHEVGQAAQQAIRSYTPENMAHSFKQAIASGGH